MTRKMGEIVLKFWLVLSDEASGLKSFGYLIAYWFSNGGFMGVLATIFIGLIIGLVARFLMPGRDPMGFILTAILGIVGAWLGSWVGVQTGMYAQGEAAGFIMAVFGACIVLFIYRMVAGRKSALR